MATITLPDEIESVINTEVEQSGYASAGEYLTSLVRQDQKRRAKEQLEALVLGGINAGEPVEMTAEAWRELRLGLHRQAEID
jgi:antitoxin ParD1/3/4